MNIKKCPKCKQEYSAYPAISRADNKTEICSLCGITESLVNWLFPRLELKTTCLNHIEKDIRIKLKASSLVKPEEVIRKEKNKATMVINKTIKQYKKKMNDDRSRQGQELKKKTKVAE